MASGTALPKAAQGLRDLNKGFLGGSLDGSSRAQRTSQKGPRGGLRGERWGELFRIPSSHAGTGNSAPPRGDALTACPPLHLTGSRQADGQLLPWL